MKFRLIAKGISIKGGWVCSLGGGFGKKVGELTQGPHVPEVTVLKQGQTLQGASGTSSQAGLDSASVFHLLLSIQLPEGSPQP